MSEAERIARLETVVEEIKDSTLAIRESLAALTRLEVHHADTRDALARAFTALKEQDVRVRVIETEMPSLRQVKQWVFGAAGGIVAIVGIAIVYLVVRR